jgi:cell wall-associated NlpC family hydrolase
MRFTRYILTAVLAVLFALPVAKDGNQFVAVEVEYDAPSMLSEASEEIAEVERIAKADNIINTALKYLGVKYRWGESSPEGFDCSGFTKYVFNEEGINLTRTSYSQCREGEKIDGIENLKRGDLVFFGGENSIRTVGHVGIVTEVDSVAHRFKFVHASRTGIKVDKSTDSYYRLRYIGARRIIQ